MQTGLEVDLLLLADALDVTGLNTVRNVVELGLRTGASVSKTDPEATRTEVMTDLPGMQNGRAETILKLLAEGEWISAAAAPEATAWQERGWIFGVQATGQLYFARYQFDEHALPRPVIRAILAELRPATDPWTIAAWFHFPNGWIVEDGGACPVAPKDALDDPAVVLEAARRFRGTYVA